MFDIPDESLSDQQGEYDNFSSSVQAGEEKVDDGHQEHRAARNSPLPVKSRGSGLAKK